MLAQLVGVDWSSECDRAERTLYMAGNKSEKSTPIMPMTIKTSTSVTPKRLVFSRGPTHIFFSPDSANMGDLKSQTLQVEEYCDRRMPRQALYPANEMMQQPGPCGTRLA